MGAIIQNLWEQIWPNHANLPNFGFLSRKHQDSCFCMATSKHKTPRRFDTSTWLQAPIQSWIAGSHSILKVLKHDPWDRVPGSFFLQPSARIRMIFWVCRSPQIWPWELKSFRVFPKISYLPWNQHEGWAYKTHCFLEAWYMFRYELIWSLQRSFA